MESNKKNELTILRRKQVEAKTGLPRSSIYARIRLDPKRPEEYDPTFPKPISIGARAVGWVESEIDAWIESQMKKRKSFDNQKQAKKEKFTNLNELITEIGNEAKGIAGEIFKNSTLVGSQLQVVLHANKGHELLVFDKSVSNVADFISDLLGVPVSVSVIAGDFENLMAKDN